MPPWWKIRRELIRPFRQLASFPIRFSSFVAGRFYYDTFLKKHARTHVGPIPLSSKVCIYVLYPSSPKCESQLVAMESLRRDGFSVLAVSNKYLETKTIEKLLEVAAVLIERVNFGYDFGGYRDGVCYLYDNKHIESLQYLLLMNDSCWYPMTTQNWPELAISQGKDFVGATSAYGVSYSRLEIDPHKHWVINKERGYFHYASYALMIGQAVLKQSGFQNFFRHLALTNNKKYTVRRGEVGLTKLIKKMAASHGETHSIETLPRILGQRSRDEIFNMVEHSTLLDGNHLVDDKRALVERIRSKQEEQSRLRQECEAYLLRLIARQGLCYSLPVWLIAEQKFPFLKKSLIHMSHENAHTIARTCTTPSAAYIDKLRREILNAIDRSDEPRTPT
jgi:lipopolysaccharide biosynthesis protein